MFSFRQLVSSCLVLLSCAVISPLSFSPSFVSGTNLLNSRFSLFGAGNDDYAVHCSSGDGNGFYLVGTTTGNQLEGNANPTQGGNDVFIAKFNNARQQVWLRFITTPAEDDAGWCDSASDGSVIVTGLSRGSLDIDHPNSGGGNTFVAKYDASGNRVFLSNVLSGSDNSAIRVFIRDGGASLLIVGYTSAYLYVMSLSASNPTDHSSNYYSYHTYGPQYLTLTDVTIDVSGRVLVSAWSSSNVPSVSNPVTGTIIAGFNNAGSYDGILYIFDSTLTLQQILPQQSGGDDRTYTVATDVTGSIYVGGYSTNNFYGQLHSQPGYPWTFVMKYDPSGNQIWTRLFGGPYYAGNRIFVDNLGAIYVHQEYNCNAGAACSAGSGSQLIKMDVNGNSQWAEYIPAGIARIVLDSTGTFTASGSTYGSVLGLNSVGNSWDGFVYQAKLNYNCSCGDLASLVNDVTQLLNIVPY